MLRQVMFASVANNENHDRILVETLRDAQSCRKISAGRPAAEDSLQSPEQSRHFERFAIGYIYHFVDELDVDVRGDDFLADSSHEIRSRLWGFACFLVGLENRTVGIRADDPDRRILFFQIPAGSRDRAAGSDSRDEVSDLPFRLPPQFR